MKKSEAVKLIEEVVRDTYDYDPDLGWTVDAEAVLDALLKEGMLPPSYSACILTHKPKERGELLIYQWEPEE